MKKLNKLFAILIAMAMVLSLTVISAFAALPADKQPADGYLVKYLKVAEGVAVPEVTSTFEFKFESDSSGRVTTATAAEAIADQDIVISATDGNDTQAEDGNSKWNSKKISTFLPTYNHAGVYTYTVTEKSATITNGDATTQKVEEVGTGKYTMRVYVENENGTLVVKHITVATYGSTTDDGKKTIGNEDPTKTDVDEFSFTNLYTKTNGKDEEDIKPEAGKLGALNVQKSVVDAPTADASKTFPFTVALTPAVGHETDTLTAYIWSKGTDGTYTKGTTPYNFVGATPVTDIPLAADDILIFDKVPAGTRYTATETLANAEAYKYYNPKYEVTSADANAAKSGSEAAGVTLATAGDATKNGTYLLTENEDANKGALIAYTNTYDKAAAEPEGILISNLPYIALALVAIGGLVAYVVIRRRNADEV